ncbi:unnamed protein product [Paramecium primaurelia]|uniref:PB1 domain-containing protein n=1 Tax=Paramecium primaurelia TaxID=5886 RepID=A0A8S1Q0H5_PARPR|nr:unnamed protein product [Paramecium primaurelia]
MDIQVRYQNEQITFIGVQSYEDLQQEIQQRYPLLTNIELSYQDEEGDTIQVSNTSDIIAITDFTKVILQMDAQIDQQKIQELERAKKVEELKQKRLEEQRKKKMEEIQKEMDKIQEINSEKAFIEEQFKQKSEDLRIRCEELQQYQNQPLPDFKQVFYDSNFLDLIRQKESELLVLVDQKGFDTQLKANQKNFQETFEKLFARRTIQHQENYSRWLDNKHKINDINQQIKQVENERLGKLQKLDEKLKRLQENLIKIKADLNMPQQNDDQF